MAERKKTGRSPKQYSGVQATHRQGRAESHGDLANEDVHIFVDDQNLFWGIVNRKYGSEFRIDFGRLLMVACRNSGGNSRFVRSAYIAGVIPGDDSFWDIARNQGFTVRRGCLAPNGRSKQDDAHLTTEIISTVYEQEGPSTLVLVSGDADYVPPLKKSIDKGWRNEIVFIDRGISMNLESVVHEIRTISLYSIQYMPS